MRPTSAAALRLLSAPEAEGSAVICFPPAGAGASFYRFLPAALGDVFRAPVPVLAVQYSGRETRFGEPHHDSRAQRVDEAVDAIEAVLPPVPGGNVLLGHSLGAQIAFETALALERAGHTLGGVVLSARAIPGGEHAAATNPPDPSTATPRELLHWLVSLGGTPPEVLAHPELTALIAPALRADLHASAEPGPAAGHSLRAPVLVIVGDSDPAVPIAATRGWAEQTRGEVTHRVLRGDHDALRSDPSWIPALLPLLGRAEPVCLVST